MNLAAVLSISVLTLAWYIVPFLVACLSSVSPEDRLPVKDKRLSNNQRCWYSIPVIYMKSGLSLLTIVVIIISSVGYKQALDRESRALQLEQEQQVPYQCQYTLISIDYCTDINCQIYSFKLSYDQLSKEIVVQCDRRDTCQQFPASNSNMTCYLVQDVNTLTYIRPTVDYYDPQLFLGSIIVQSICFCLQLCWYLFYRHKLHGCGEQEHEQEVDVMGEGNDKSDTNTISTASAPIEGV